MSEKLGAVAFGDQDEQPFLGRELAHSKNYSEHTAQMIDEEIRRFLTEGYEMSRRLITENMEKVELLAQALIEFETLDIADVNILLESGMDALRTEMKNRETGDKERVAKFAFESKLAQKMAESVKNTNDSLLNNLPPIELEPDDKDKKEESV